MSILKASWSVRRRSCVDLGAALVCSWDHVSISEQLGFFVGIVFGGLDRLETRLEFHFEVKFRSLSSLDLFSFDFPHCVLMFSGGEWSELISQR